jgi:hypothetical protein
VGVGVGVGGGAMPAEIALSNTLPTGLPQPVQASQPGPALKSPLFPEVMSRNVPDFVAYV